MAYNKTTWANGDIITAEKLNNIEEGIVNINNIIQIPFESNGSYISSPYSPFDVQTFLQQGKKLQAKITFLNDNPVTVHRTSIYNYTFFNYELQQNGIDVRNIGFIFFRNNHSLFTIYSYDNGDAISWKLL